MAVRRELATHNPDAVPTDGPAGDRHVESELSHNEGSLCFAAAS
jgi:hypothetical protein